MIPKNYHTYVQNILNEKVSRQEKARQLRNLSPAFFTFSMIGKILGVHHSTIARYLS